MGEIDELRRRLDTLEAQVHEVTEQQAATRHLAVNADHGVAALQDHRRTDVQLLQALRTTQLDQGKILEEHSRLLGVLVSGQVAIMEHLGINPPETAAEGG